MELNSRVSRARARDLAGSMQQHGPTDIKEVMDWPVFAFASLQASEHLLPPHALARLHMFLEEGVSTSSAYSGMGGDIVGCQLMFREAQRVGCVSQQAVGFHWQHAGDVDEVCRSVLKSFEPKWAPRHITTDLADRIPAGLLDELDKNAPKRDGDPKDFDRRYGAMRDSFKDWKAAGKDIFGAGTKCWCVQHNDWCEIYKPAVSCKLSLGWAGTTCLDICRPGKRFGHHGPHSKTFRIWLEERRCRREHIYIQESTQDFCTADIDCELGDLFDVFGVLLGPEDFGWWSSRPRHFCIMILKEHGVLAVDNFSSFEQMFARCRSGLSHKGHMFWCAKL